MSRNRHRPIAGKAVIIGVMAIWWLAAVSGPASGGAPGVGGSPPGPGPHLILSGEFFSALEKLAGSGVVTGDRQENLLEQVALAQKFIVKTNLTLIEQNERIIRLLEELNRKLPKVGP